MRANSAIRQRNVRMHTVFAPGNGEPGAVRMGRGKGEMGLREKMYSTSTVAQQKKTVAKVSSISFHSDVLST